MGGFAWPSFLASAMASFMASTSGVFFALFLSTLVLGFVGGVAEVSESLDLQADEIHQQQESLAASRLEESVGRRAGGGGGMQGALCLSAAGSNTAGNDEEDENEDETTLDSLGEAQAACSNAEWNAQVEKLKSEKAALAARLARYEAPNDHGKSGELAVKELGQGGS